MVMIGSSMKKQFFVAHGFDVQQKDDLRRAIEEAFRGTGLEAYYADMEVRQKHILEKIKEKNTFNSIRYL